MIISIADIRAFAGRRTNTTEVVNMLKKFGIKLSISSTTILDKVSQVRDKVDQKCDNEIFIRKLGP